MAETTRPAPGAGDGAGAPHAAPAAAEQAAAAQAAGDAPAHGTQGSHRPNGADGAQAPGAAAPSSRAADAPQGTSSTSLLQTLKALWRDLPGLVSDRVELLSLELRRAGIALAQIVALGVVAAILGLTAWVLLWGAIVTGLQALGLHLALAMLVAMLPNLVAVAVVLMLVRKQVALLRLPATRRHLTVKAAIDPLKPSGPPRSAPASPSTHGSTAADGDARPAGSRQPERAA